MIEIAKKGESVMNVSDVINMFDSCYQHNGVYYPPVNLAGLAKTMNLAFHGSAVHLKKNILSECFIPHPKLSRSEFTALALDYVLFNNGYLLRVRNGAQQAIKYQRRPAKYMRRQVADINAYAEMQSGFYGALVKKDYQAGEIGHAKGACVHQELFGMPEWLNGLSGALLNESATLLRRAYYENGNHAGFILYLTDEDLEDDEVDTLQKKIENIKGADAFKNIMIHAAGGRKDDINLIPMGEASAKDEFFNVAKISQEIIVSAHRVIPQFIGIQSQTHGGFGDIEKGALVLAKNEIYPLFRQLEELNEWAGEKIITWDPYTLDQLEQVTE